MIDENHIPPGSETVETAAQNDLSEYWQILLGSRKIVLTITAIVATCSILYHAGLPNKYAATAQVLVEKVMPQTGRSYQEMILPAFWGEEDYYGTQVAMMTGRRVTEIVQSDLPEARGFKINAKRLKNTRIIQLSVIHRDPEVAARICNKFAEVYVRESTRESLFMSQQLLQLIPEDLEALKNSETMNSLDKIGGFSKKEFAESLASVMNDPVVQKMREEKLSVESKLAELSQRYRAEHPLVKQTHEQLRYIETELKDRTTRILGNLKANLAGEINISNIRVLEPAVVPEKPSEPNRARGILFHTVLGFIGSMGLVLFMEQINQKIRYEKDLYPAIHLPFLGYIPFAKVFVMKKKDAVTGGVPEVSLVNALQENSILSDAVAGVRTHLLFSMPYEKSRKIMLTSAIPNEGKSTVAALLALSLTTLGRKILLVDSDLRKPYLHNYLELKNEKGLTDYLVGDASMEEVIRSVLGSALKVVTAGSVSHNPSELLASERFRELLDWALQNFDRVIIDVPPTLYIPDGLVVAKHVHTSVLVCGSGMVYKNTVRTIIEKFDAIGHSFIGVVINRADYEREHYRYRYYKTYKDYYSKKGSFAGGHFKKDFLNRLTHKVLTGRNG